MEEKLETHQLTAEMEKLLNRMQDEFLSFLVELSGNLKDIDNGTRIKIPTDVGYVNFYKSLDEYSMSLWMKNTVTEPEM